MRGSMRQGLRRGENGDWRVNARREKRRMELGIAVCVIRMFLQRKQVLFTFDSSSQCSVSGLSASILWRHCWFKRGAARTPQRPSRGGSFPSQNAARSHAQRHGLHPLHARWIRRPAHPSAPTCITCRACARGCGFVYLTVRARRLGTP